ncbi:unnamed protein product, partial [Brassica rapa subsp. narinosa]
KSFNPAPPPPASSSTAFPVSLSSSLRQSDSSSRAPAPGGSRVRIGDQGQLVAQGGGSFFNYLPQDEAVAAGLGPEDGGLDPVESQGVVDLLNRALARLLKLSPRLFWREVASDASLHDFLDSFLQFRSRWYDFPFHGVKCIVAGVVVGEIELCRRVFMVLYRISSHRDPGARAADSLSQKDHEGGLLLLFFYANMLFISFFLKKEHRINDCPHGLFTFHFPLRFWISIQILCVEVFVYIVVGVCAKHTYFVVC